MDWRWFHHITLHCTHQIHSLRRTNAILYASQHVSACKSYFVARERSPRYIHTLYIRSHQLQSLNKTSVTTPNPSLSLSLSLSLSHTHTHTSNMKKLHGKDTAHRLPPLTSNQLALLPATILTLTAALSPEDREVLAYLISCSSSNFSGNRRNTQKTNSGGEHPPSFSCNCFSCYMSYWVRWDSSPNRQLIHEIIDAVENELVQSKKDKNKEKRDRGSNRSTDELKRSESTSVENEFGPPETVDKAAGPGDAMFEKGSVRKFVSLIGERIWSVWTS